MFRPDLLTGAQTEQLSTRAMDAVLAPTLHRALYCTMGVGRRLFRWMLLSGGALGNSAWQCASA